MQIDNIHVKTCIHCGYIGLYDEFRKNKNVCLKCDRLAKTKYNDSIRNRFFNFNGVLDPNSGTGIGVITEKVVELTLTDCVNCNEEKFNKEYDLISKKYGSINVKSSTLKFNKRDNVYYWWFGKTKHSKIPDYYICLAFNKDKSEILHVWIVRGSANIVRKTGFGSYKNIVSKLNEYEVDATQYNINYKNLDIYSLPAFCNLNKSKEIVINANDGICSA